MPGGRGGEGMLYVIVEGNARESDEERKKKSNESKQGCHKTHIITHDLLPSLYPDPHPSYLRLEVVTKW